MHVQSSSVIQIITIITPSLQTIKGLYSIYYKNNNLPVMEPEKALLHSVFHVDSESETDQFDKHQVDHSVQ